MVLHGLQGGPSWMRGRVGTETTSNRTMPTGRPLRASRGGLLRSRGPHGGLVSPACRSRRGAAATCGGSALRVMCVSVAVAAASAPYLASEAGLAYAVPRGHWLGGAVTRSRSASDSVDHHRIRRICEGSRGLESRAQVAINTIADSYVWVESAKPIWSRTAARRGGPRAPMLMWWDVVWERGE